MLGRRCHDEYIVMTICVFYITYYQLSWSSRPYSFCWMLVYVSYQDNVLFYFVQLSVFRNQLIFSGLYMYQVTEGKCGIFSNVFLPRDYHIPVT